MVWQKKRVYIFPAQPGRLGFPKISFRSTNYAIIRLLVIPVLGIPWLDILTMSTHRKQKQKYIRLRVPGSQKFLSTCIQHCVHQLLGTSHSEAATACVPLFSGTNFCCEPHRLSVPHSGKFLKHKPTTQVLKQSKISTGFLII